MIFLAPTNKNMGKRYVRSYRHFNDLYILLSHPLLRPILRVGTVGSTSTYPNVSKFHNDT